MLSATITNAPSEQGVRGLGHRWVFPQKWRMSAPAEAAAMPPPLAPSGCAEGGED